MNSTLFVESLTVQLAAWAGVSFVLAPNPTQPTSLWAHRLDDRTDLSTDPVSVLLAWGSSPNDNAAHAELAIQCVTRGSSLRETLLRAQALHAALLGADKLPRRHVVLPAAGTVGQPDYRPAFTLFGITDLTEPRSIGEDPTDRKQEVTFNFTASFAANG